MTFHQSPVDLVLAITALASLVLNGIMVSFMWSQTRAWRVFARAQTNVAATYEKEMKALRKQMAATRKAAGLKHQNENEKIAIQQQRLAQQERKLEMEKVKLAGKAIKWLLEAD